MYSGWRGGVEPSVVMSWRSAVGRVIGFILCGTPWVKGESKLTKGKLSDLLANIPRAPSVRACLAQKVDSLHVYWMNAGTNESTDINSMEEDMSLCTKDFLTAPRIVSPRRHSWLLFVSWLQPLAQSLGNCKPQGPSWPMMGWAFWRVVDWTRSWKVIRRDLVPKGLRLEDFEIPFGSDSMF